ncbi:GNAT family N-acetyltransferase [Bifidobacterium sp. ESL0690]|uniref:GNAT family N-acetyltransferase n=1 Tax=Bifidobacterium sp. ESL0690 TaxID=2983214 RepID=UPI0023F77879|nr:GNAT family N-acetyltransferase [Bifidobacterium sp. ESL0690]WEV47211.1 GNAT family N-acetyltransferase [Bifidobacterium sp. ESL0690]
MSELDLTIKTTDELNPSELLEIFRERVKVFVVEQHCPYQEVDDKDFTATHVMLQRDGKLAAYTRIIKHDDGVHISFGRVLVVQEYRGHGYAKQIVSTTLQEIAKRHPGQGVKIQAQSYLKDFYASFGFKSISAVYLEDGIPHVDMVLEKRAQD